MSINPPSDIVLGVARAADPGAYRAAAERLERVGTTSASSVAQPVQQPTSAMKLSAQEQVKGVAPPSRSHETTRSLPKAPDEKAKAYEQFEGFLLQTFVEAMLPKNAPNVFGSGPAGDIWKSMMAQYLAKEMAESTKFGIAEQIAEYREKFGKDNRGSPAISTSAESAGLNSFTEQLPYLSAILTNKTNNTEDSPADTVNSARGS